MLVCVCPQAQRRVAASSLPCTSRPWAGVWMRRHPRASQHAPRWPSEAALEHSLGSGPAVPGSRDQRQHPGLGRNSAAPAHPERVTTLFNTLLYFLYIRVSLVILTGVYIYPQARLHLYIQYTMKYRFFNDNNNIITLYIIELYI